MTDTTASPRPTVAFERRRVRPGPGQTHLDIRHRWAASNGARGVAFYDRATGMNTAVVDGSDRRHEGLTMQAAAEAAAGKEPPR